MEEKDKKLSFKVIAIILLLIIFVISAFRCFYHSGSKSYDNASSITLVDSNDNLNKSWSINQDGNLVGNNLCNLSYSGTYVGYNVNINYGVLNISGDYTSGYTSIDIANNLIGNTDYTISCEQLKTYSDILFWVYDVNGVFLGQKTLINGVANFNYPTTYRLSFVFRDNTFDNNTNTFYFMLNMGSSPLNWEPYGVWYSQGNYNYVNDQYEAISGQINPLDVSHIIEHIEILNGTNITSEVGSSPLVSNINNGLGFYCYDFDGYSSWSSTSQNVITSTNKFNTVYTLQGCKAYSSLLHSLDDYYDFTFYLNNEIVFTYPNIDSETASEYMQNYETTNIQFDMIVFNIVITQDSANIRPGSNYFVATNNYAFGYQQGYRDGVDSQSDAINYAFNNGVNYADSNVNENSSSYKVGYANGFEHGEDSSNYLKTTIFAIADTPLRVFKQIFSFDVLGINLAGIVLSVMSIFLVIWLFKKFH